MRLFQLKPLDAGDSIGYQGINRLMNDFSCQGIIGFPCRKDRHCECGNFRFFCFLKPCNPVVGLRMGGSSKELCSQSRPRSTVIKDFNHFPDRPIGYIVGTASVSEVLPPSATLDDLAPVGLTEAAASRTGNDHHVSWSLWMMILSHLQGRMKIVVHPEGGFEPDRLGGLLNDRAILLLTNTSHADTNGCRTGRQPAASNQ